MTVVPAFCAPARRFVTAYASLFVLIASAGSCRETPSAPQLRANRAVALVVISGDAQVANIGTTLPQPIVAKVVDDVGSPVAGVVVNFRVTEGGGSVFAGSAISGADGIVRERWSLGWVPRSGQVVEARGVSTATGDSIVYQRFTATARVPAGINKVWTGGTDGFGDTHAWQNDYNWYPVGAPVSTDAVLIPGYAPDWPVLEGAGSNLTIGKLVMKDGARLRLGMGEFSISQLVVLGTVDNAGVVSGPGRIAQGTGTLRGVFSHLYIMGTVTMNGDVTIVPTGTQSPDTPDGRLEINDDAAAMLRVGKYSVDISRAGQWQPYACNVVMTNSAGRLTLRGPDNSFYCFDGTFSAGIVTTTQAFGWLPGHVSGTNTVILDSGPQDVVTTSGGGREFQNLRVRGTGRGGSSWSVVGDSLLIKGNLFVDSGTLRLSTGLIRVLGNVTVASGAKIANAGTIHYSGTLTNKGTIEGNALESVAP